MSRGVDLCIVSEMVARSERTVREWLADRHRGRLRSEVTGHTCDENATKITWNQEAQLKRC